MRHSLLDRVGQVWCDACSTFLIVSSKPEKPGSRWWTHELVELETLARRYYSESRSNRWYEGCEDDDELWRLT